MNEKDQRGGRVPRESAKQYEAFGESKTLTYWLLDERCVVKSADVLYRRINSGWTVEDALTTPQRGYNLGCNTKRTA